MNPFHSIKAILFDFGGTLDTDGVHWSEKFWEAYQAAGVPIKKTEYEKAFVDAGDHLVSARILPHYNFKETIATQIELQLQFLEIHFGLPYVDHNHYKEVILTYAYEEASKTLDKTKHILDRLSQHHLLGVVSNFYGNLETVLDEFDILIHLQVVIDSAKVGIRKPNPAIFRLATEHLGIAPQNTLMVGDSYDRDIVPAKQCGCITVWLEGKSWKDEVGGKEADYIIHSLSELETLIYNTKLF